LRPALGWERGALRRFRRCLRRHIIELRVTADGAGAAVVVLGARRFPNQQTVESLMKTLGLAVCRETDVGVGHGQFIPPTRDVWASGDPTATSQLWRMETFRMF
jgi:hypothetical protein